jgi:hypothetical protein
MEGSVSKIRKDARSNRQPSRQWYLAHGQAEAFIRRILPFLVQKLPEARLALEYREKAIGRGKTHFQIVYWRRMKTFKNYRDPRLKEELF